MKNMVDMEAMKAKYSEESPEDQQKRKRQLMFPAFINFAVGIAMLVVGIVYDPEDNIGAATDFLMVSMYSGSHMKSNTARFIIM